MKLTLLDPATDDFPPVELALKEPNGLLAIGGDLRVSRLMTAYQCGIFPWYEAGQPILWWSPNPRAIFYLDEIKISRSLKRTLRHQTYIITLDKDFRGVIEGCAQPRPTQPRTWITPEMQAAYCRLHYAGYGHSIEVWHEEKLVGGLYGVDCWPVFTGESMFCIKPDVAKIALVYLANYLKSFGYLLLDCQLLNPFLITLGASEITRADFLRILTVEKNSARPFAFESMPTTLPKLFF